jgi:putative tryptophan/tyrosine transport system substrate-binding protein
MRRRQFIALLGATAARPLAVQAQQPEQVRRIAVLMSSGATDPLTQARLTAFKQVLQTLGWVEGRNLRIEARYGAGDIYRIRLQAAELVSLKPDVIRAISERAVNAVLGETRTIPTVFIGLSDPVGQGIVTRVARPGGSITGFVQFDFEFLVVGKFLEALKDVAPRLDRVLLLYNPANSAAADWIRTLENVAPSLSVKPVASAVHNAAEIERAIEAFGGHENGGLILPPDSTTNIHRDLIVTVAARHKLPLVASDPSFVSNGGLMCYGPDRIEIHRQAAGHVNRILMGENPSDLPVQAPTKYELVINLKVAKALGLTVPPQLLARAAEVIEQVFCASAQVLKWHEA